jgi:hypothetical protein
MLNITPPMWLKGQQKGCSLYTNTKTIIWKFYIFCFRYDVELYQRIEHLIGKKLPLYKTEEQEVMLLMERVTEAQRFAKLVR